MRKYAPRGAVQGPSEIVAVGGAAGLKPKLGLAGSCPAFQYTADAIPNEPGVGFGVCFIPRISFPHATLGIRYTVTLPGEGAVNPRTGEHVKVVNGFTNCFNGKPCFGGYIPDQFEFVPGTWLFEFYRVDQKILEYRFVVKPAVQQALAEPDAPPGAFGARRPRRQ